MVPAPTVYDLPANVAALTPFALDQPLRNTKSSALSTLIDRLGKMEKESKATQKDFKAAQKESKAAILELTRKLESADTLIKEAESRLVRSQQEMSAKIEQQQEEMTGMQQHIDELESDHKDVVGWLTQSVCCLPILSAMLMSCDRTLHAWTESAFVIYLTLSKANWHRWLGYLNTHRLLGETGFARSSLNLKGSEKREGYLFFKI